MLGVAGGDQCALDDLFAVLTGTPDAGSDCQIDAFAAERVARLEPQRVGGLAGCGLVEVRAEQSNPATACAKGLGSFSNPEKQTTLRWSATVSWSDSSDLLSVDQAHL
ncbi:MAG: hypothetical protein M3022_04470 [Actinomycetota bacterium]|nr:hypothetical protein [Actinomycetota bacterium]